MKWWEKFSPEVQESIAKEFWKLYSDMVLHLDITYPEGGINFWEGQRQSLKLLNQWIEICQKLKKIIR
jgi:hypothetical protein